LEFLVQTMPMYADAVFGPLDADHHLERIAGGNETEVYRSDDGRLVVKLKSDSGGTAALALAEARTMRDAAEQFAACLGPEHSIPSHYVVSANEAGHAQVLVVQPYLAGATPLFFIDYAGLSQDSREAIAHELRDIVRRALSFYRLRGSMPDLYGRNSGSHDERRRLNGPLMLPRRMWSFVVRRNLLRSRNLMLTAQPPNRIVLVDYDTVRRSLLYRAVYFAARWMLFWRDHVLIIAMRHGGHVPRGE
jgi:hypothetical protein